MTVAGTDRPQCCWTHCGNEQGIGTWTDINGETLPVCEEHWFGNLDRERRQLREAAQAVLDACDAVSATFGEGEEEMTVYADSMAHLRKVLG